MARGPKQIGDVLAELMARHGYARVNSSEQLDAAWNEAAGPLAAKYSRVGLLRRGTLEVIVHNSTLVQEFSFQKATLLEQLAQLLPDETIRDIRFRVGVIE